MSQGQLREWLRAGGDLISGPDSAWFWTMAQVLVIGFSVWFISKQIRLQGHANMLHALFGLAGKWSSDSMLEARKAVCLAFREEEPGNSLDEKHQRVASFFEDIGVYLRYGCFTREAIWEGYSYYIEHYWPLLEERIKLYRTQTEDGTWFENFEALYEAMRKASKRKGAPTSRRSETEMAQFTRGELQTASVAERTVS
jgi:hypothetical protein